MNIILITLFNYDFEIKTDGCGPRGFLRKSFMLSVPRPIGCLLEGQMDGLLNLLAPSHHIYFGAHLLELDPKLIIYIYIYKE